VVGSRHYAPVSVSDGKAGMQTTNWQQTGRHILLTIWTDAERCVSCKKTISIGLLECGVL